MNKISLSKHMLQPAAPRSLQHSHSVCGSGKRETGIHSAHNSADLSHSCVYVCVSAFVYLWALFMWETHQQLVETKNWYLGPKTSVSVYAYMHVFMKMCHLNSDYAYTDKAWVVFYAAQLVYLCCESIFVKALCGEQLKNVWERLCWSCQWNHSNPL